MPIIALFAWATSVGVVCVGAFLMQLMVQGSRGVVPAHLTELSPDEIRGCRPGVSNQLGSLPAEPRVRRDRALHEPAQPLTHSAQTGAGGGPNPGGRCPGE